MTGNRLSPRLGPAGQELVVVKKAGCCPRNQYKGASNGVVGVATLGSPVVGHAHLRIGQC